jgi:hypothetical protein
MCNLQSHHTTEKKDQVKVESASFLHNIYLHFKLPEQNRHLNRFRLFVSEGPHQKIKKKTNIIEILFIWLLKQPGHDPYYSRLMLISTYVTSHNCFEENNKKQFRGKYSFPIQHIGKVFEMNLNAEHFSNSTYCVSYIS